jgi:HK97 family phage prohead protease
MPVPTEAMAAEAKRGLAWREEYNRGGTAVGVARARDISNRVNLSDETIGRMVSYFARHEVDKQAEGFSPGEDGYPSAGRIAWALWGGDPGKAWADREWAKIQDKGGKMMQRKNISLGEMELKFAANGGFKGYASVFGGVDSYNDTIVAGAYKEVIDRVQKGDALMPKMFINHRAWEIPVGKWTYMEEDSKGLYMEGEFTKGNPQADIIKAALQHGTVDGLSIGFILGDYEDMERDGEKLRVIKSIKELPEVSIVTYPADDNARVDLTTVKSALDNISTVRDFEKFLREVAGFSNSLARETAKTAQAIFSHLGDAKTEDLPNDLKLDADLQRQIALQVLLSKTL